jgi:hypothetical protein
MMLPVTEQPRTLGKYPLTASLYLEKNDPKQHAGMWLSWIFASWRRQQVDEPFWDYVERVAQDPDAFRRIVERDTGLTDLHPLSAAIHFELFQRGMRYVAESTSRS